MLLLLLHKLLFLQESDVCRFMGTRGSCTMLFTNQQPHICLGTLCGSADGSDDSGPSGWDGGSLVLGDCWGGLMGRLLPLLFWTPDHWGVGGAGAPDGVGWGSGPEDGASVGSWGQRARARAWVVAWGLGCPINSAVPKELPLQQR